MQLLILFIIYFVAISSAFMLVHALRSGKYGWAYVSAAFATPICFFVAGYPALYYIPLVFPIAILAGAVCIKKQRRGLAMALFTPYLLLWAGLMITILVNMEF
ncbi:MAG: hypothetical protein ACSHXZ_04180 [Gammaproteobacteria bacterium]